MLKCGLRVFSYHFSEVWVIFAYVWPQRCRREYLMSQHKLRVGMHCVVTNVLAFMNSNTQFWDLRKSQLGPKGSLRKTEEQQCNKYFWSLFIWAVFQCFAIPLFVLWKRFLFEASLRPKFLQAADSENSFSWLRIWLSNWNLEVCSHSFVFYIVFGVAILVWYLVCIFWWSNLLLVLAK